MDTTADQQTYKRAANAALIGLVTQLALAIVTALLGLYAQASAIHAVTWHLFGGLAIWVVLWLLYQQHRQERLEALEAEQLAQSDEEAARLFDEAGQQLALARRRLEGLYKYGLTGVSVAIALYLLLVGGSLFYLNYDQGQALAQAAGLSEQAKPLVVALIAALVAFVAFIVGRYVSGMTRIQAWALLRGGAGYLIGSALLAVLVTAAAVAAFFGRSAGFSVLALLVPAVMTLLGLEMGLALLFSIYRPRRHGEMPRPGFDSRILGWLTSPESIGRIVSETLNYQFGFEISRSWFYQLLSRAITPLIVVGALVLIAFSSIVIVPPGKQAIITAFGAMGDPPRVADPGLHVKWPWPLGGAQKYATGRVRSMEIGAKHQGSHDNFLWADGRRGAQQDQEFLVTAPPAVDDSDLGVPLPIGELLGARMQIKYTIDDLPQYVRAGGGQLDHRAREGHGHGHGHGQGHAAEGPMVNSADHMLELLAQREMTSYFATKTIDHLLAGGREQAGKDLRTRLQAAADRRELGLKVSYVGVVHVHPPQTENVVQAFHEKIAARQEKEATIQEARKEAASTLAGVAGSPTQAKAISDAKAKLDRLQAKRNDAAETLDALQNGGQDDAQADADPAALKSQIAELEKQLTEQKLKIESLIDQAGGQAAELLAQARAYRWEQPLQARGKAERFTAQVLAYDQAPRYYRMRQYLDVLGENLVDPRKIIMTAKTQAPPTIRLNLESARTGLETILGEGENQ
jgi:regulator of protease activity HflC (stomatin/prohibitin superfamily)